jgi:hypothetical protein
VSRQGFPRGRMLVMIKDDDGDEDDDSVLYY